MFFNLNEMTRCTTCIVLPEQATRTLKNYIPTI